MKAFYTIPQQKLMVRPWDFLKGISSKEADETRIREFIPQKQLYWTSSARNALYVLLDSLQNTAGKKLSVAIPAFTCHVVQDAAQRTKSKILYYDSGITTNLKDIKKVLTKKPDILLLCYNFGYLPKDLQEIAELCKKHNVILIEDCAQALGATQKGKLAGSFGDYAIYSFGISKNIGFDGGLIATNESLQLKKQEPISVSEMIRTTIKSIIGPLALRKGIFPLTQHFMKQGLEQRKHYPPKEYQLSNFSKRVVCSLAKRYKKVLKTRQENYSLLTGKSTTDACLYFPITNKTKEIKEKAARKSIELEDMKSFAFLPEESQMKQFPNAAAIAKNHLTFALLRSKKEIRKIREVLELR